MRTPRLLPAAAALFLLITGLAAPVHAVIVTLDFEEAPLPAVDTQIGIAEYDEDGFHIQPLGPIDLVPPFRLRRNGGPDTDPGFAGFPDNGTAYLQLATGDSFEMTQTGGAAFAPISIDLAEFSDLFSGLSTSITFTGFFPDTSSVMTTFITDGIIDGSDPLLDFETFFFPSLFSGIVRLEVSDIPDPLFSFSLDRLSVDNVPEPSRTVLLALALGFATLRRRRSTAGT